MIDDTIKHWYNVYYWDVWDDTVYDMMYNLMYGMTWYYIISYVWNYEVWYDEWYIIDNLWRTLIWQLIRVSNDDNDSDDHKYKFVNLR